MATTLLEHVGGQRGRRLISIAAVAALMVIPVAVLRIIEGGAWDAGDVAFLCMLIAILAGACELAARATYRRAYALGATIAVATALLQAWINLAVGVIGSEDNPANLMYAGVIGVALIGAVLARFRPAGMGLP